MLKEKIKALAHTIAPELIGIRHHLHAHPELCFEEVRTADLVAAKLTEWGIEVRRGAAMVRSAGKLRACR